MSKKKILRIADIIYILVILISVIIEFKNGITSGSISFEGLDLSKLTLNQYATFAFSMLFLCLFFIAVSLLKHLFLTIAYIGFRIGYKKYSKEKLDQTDLKNDNYFREIIDKYSPSVLSYIDDFKIEKKDIVASLLSLELKDKIKLEDDIKIINEEMDELEENEKYIFNCIKNKNVQNINLLELENKCAMDAINLGLLEEKKDIKKKIIKKIITCVIIYIIVTIGFYLLPGFFNSLESANDLLILSFISIIIILFVMMILFPMTTIIYIITYSLMNKVNPYVRNKKAKEINIKLEGLRNYIKDCSELKNKKHQDLVLWEDYIIYSIILGLNTKVVQDIVKKYDL